MKKTAEEARITRGKLRKSALRLFIKHGYSKVSLEQIAKECGMTRGAFYWHFSTKEEVLASLLDDFHKRMEEFLVELFEVPEPNHAIRLKLILNGIIENFYSNPDFRDFVKLRWFKLEQDVSDPSAVVSTITNDFMVIELIQIIKDGQERGYIRREYSPEEIAIHAASLINGIYRLYFITSFLQDVNSAKKSIEMFYESMKP